MLIMDRGADIKQYALIRQVAKAVLAIFYYIKNHLTVKIKLNGLRILLEKGVN